MHDYSQDKIFLSDFGIYEDIPWPDTAKSFLFDIEDGKECGIYKITNNINDKIYIGSSKEVKVRWEKHRRDLMMGNHNAHFQSFFNKHKNICFKFELVEECSPSERKTREQFYLDTLRPFGNRGFNVATLVTYVPINKSKGQKRPKISEKLSLRVGKPLNQYNLDGSFVKFHQTPYFAFLESGISKIGISRAAFRSKTGVFKGFLWRPNNKEYGQSNLTENQLCLLKRKSSYGKRSESEKINKSKNYGRKVGKYTVDDILIKEYDCMAIAALENNLKKENIRSCCCGKTKSGIHAGFKWKWASDAHAIICKKVGRFSFDGNLLESFESASIAQKTGLYRAITISDACRGKIQTYRGFIWKYLDA